MTDSRDIPRARVERFVRRFGEPYRKLAWYAALPLILTPELLDHLRVHFLRGPDALPWISEADLLLSELCQPVGHEQYALDQDVRAVLIAEMRAQLGEDALGEGAKLLLRYLKRLNESDTDLSPEEMQAEQWSAMGAALLERR